MRAYTKGASTPGSSTGPGGSWIRAALSPNPSTHPCWVRVDTYPSAHIQQEGYDLGALLQDYLMERVRSSRWMSRAVVSSELSSPRSSGS